MEDETEVDEMNKGVIASEDNESYSNLALRNLRHFKKIQFPEL